MDSSAGELSRPGEGSSSSFPSYIVGIGASAGGLEALERLISVVPPDTGMGFVVVQHLPPDFKSLMAGLFQRRQRG